MRAYYLSKKIRSTSMVMLVFNFDWNVQKQENKILGNDWATCHMGRGPKCWANVFCSFYIYCR